MPQAIAYVATSLDIRSVRGIHLQGYSPDLPEVRCDDILDIGGFFRFTEKTLWQAIENTGIGYNMWTARKEVHGNDPPV
ncbi:unnamed protein product, partial [marine sediment metagenome]